MAGGSGPDEPQLNGDALNVEKSCSFYRDPTDLPDLPPNKKSSTRKADVPGANPFSGRLKTLHSWGFDVEKLLQLDSAWNECLATVKFRKKYFQGIFLIRSCQKLSDSIFINLTAKNCPTSDINHFNVFCDINQSYLLLRCFTEFLKILD